MCSIDGDCIGILVSYFDWPVPEHQQIVDALLQDNPQLKIRVISQWKAFTKFTIFNDPQCILYKCNGKTHRDDDEPACIWRAGRKEWYQNNKIHRDNDQPAVICKSGVYQAWYYRGKYHRDGNKPAIILGDGSREWYLHGVKYRDTYGIKRKREEEPYHTKTMHKVALNFMRCV